MNFSCAFISFPVLKRRYREKLVLNGGMIFQEISLDKVASFVFVKEIFLLGGAGDISFSIHIFVVSLTAN